MFDSSEILVKKMLRVTLYIGCSKTKLVTYRRRK